MYPTLPVTTSLESSPAQHAQHDHSNDQSGIDNARPAHVKPDEYTLDPMLELRLMHEWSSQVPRSFSTAWEFWQRQAPLIAFEHRYVLDSLLCLAALHAHRRQPQQWLTLEGRMVPATKEPTATQVTGPVSEQATHIPWTLPSELEISDTTDVRTRLRMDKLALEQQRGEMLRAARMYFDRTLAGQNKALSAIDAESGEACYLASICVTWAALFFLGEDQDDANPWLSDPIQWVRIAHGSRVVVSSQINALCSHHMMH
jgi:hypothetical protein